MTLIRFRPSDPIDVELTRGCIDSATVGAEFWKRVSEAESEGCYVFAVPRKYGRDGFMPLYVGRTSRRFADECFSDTNLRKINEHLRHHPADSLKLILLPHPPRRGGSNNKVVEDLERDLIKMAMDVNPHLLNKQHVRPDLWGIHGVIRSGRGRVGPGSRMLADVLEIPRSPS